MNDDMRWIVVEFVQQSFAHNCSFDVTAYSLEEDARKSFDENADDKNITKVLIHGTVVEKNEN